MNSGRREAPPFLLVALPGPWVGVAPSEVHACVVPTYFVAVPVLGAPGVVDTGCATGGAAVGAVMGVTVIPVTLPLTVSFCFLLVVPRASRVALAFAAEAAFS